MTNHYGTTAHEEGRPLLNGHAVTAEANATFFGRTKAHVHHHRKRYFALWLLAAIIAFSAVFGLHYYHKGQPGNPETPAPAPGTPAPGEGEFFGSLLAGFKHPSEPCESDRSYPVAILLSVFFGYLGIDRFYLGHIFTGLIKLATAGGFGIWYVIDIVLIIVGGLDDHQGCTLIH